MNRSTAKIIKAALDADESVTPEHTQVVIDILDGKVQPKQTVQIEELVKRLADAETGLKECRARAESIRGDFISARARAKALIAKAALLSLASERKILEEEALETTIAMAAKASGKTGMMK